MPWRRLRWPRLLAAILAGSVCAGGVWAQQAEPDEADRLSRSGKLEDAQRAAELYKQRVAEDPESFDANLGLARSLAVEMAIRTNGNLPLVDGLQDSDENKAIWSELAPVALEHARKALAMRPQSVEAAAVVANTYASYASSLGIIRSILQGAGGEFRENANRLVKLDPTYEAGLGDYLLGSFYMVAPWPVGDSDEAKAHYERAAKISPKSVRNHYGLGVYWYREGEKKRARTQFEQVRDLSCIENSTEQLICDFMKKESRRALGMLGAG